jgi:hypothetical protein
MTPSNLSISARTIAQPPNLSAARNGRLTASFCYAKIAPAALHCGDFNRRRHQGIEAAGGRAEFELGDFRRVAAGDATPIVLQPGVASS